MLLAANEFAGCLSTLPPRSRQAIIQQFMRRVVAAPTFSIAPLSVKKGLTFQPASCTLACIPDTDSRRCYMQQRLSYPGADVADAEGYAAFYAPVLSSVQRLTPEKEAITMDTSNDVPAGQ